MLRPERLLRMIIEFIFVLLGLLLVWLGLAGPIYGRTVDRHGLGWKILSVALILWGLRALPWRRHWTRGLSLVVLGVLMLLITQAPFSWVGPMLAAGGAVLSLRGIIGSGLILRPR